MTYDDIAAMFLMPLADPIPVPDVAATPARRLRDALEPIATQGWWSRAAGEAMTALGIDFFPGYVWGRAAALGVPEPSVVAATFGVFEPNFIAAVYRTGAATVSRDDILSARADGGAGGVAAISSDDECADIADALITATDGLDGLGRPQPTEQRAPEGCGRCRCRPRLPAGCGGRPNSFVSTAATGTWRRSPSVASPLLRRTS